MRLPHRRVLPILATAVVVAAAACGAGVTGSADQVTDHSVRVRGEVANTVAGETRYQFEYGTSEAYGMATAWRTTVVSDPDVGVPVSATLAGLAEGTTYHYRLCAIDVDGHGVCGADATVTTTAGHDWVSGSGTVIAIGSLGYAVGGTVEASVGAGDPPTGSIETVPGLGYFRLPNSGPITCVRVEGNRASIGYLALPLEGLDPAPAPTPRLVVIEDNGPTGDRWGERTLAAPAVDCPPVTESDFPDVYVGGFSVPPVVTAGDFVVHDHIEPLAG